MARIRIGTSGWHYKHWSGTFYPAGLNTRQQFAHYASVFDTVEINNSFYRLPPPEVFEAWYEESPGAFLFAVKASRFLTHNLKLSRPHEPITRLFGSILSLKEKLGPVLFQLPPKWNVNPERLESFLQALPAGYRYVFEFRNASWFREDVLAILKRYNAACCIYELAGYLSPMLVTANFAYVRLHGPSDRKYQGSYSEAALREWAEQCLEWQRKKKDVYVYFDNDEQGYAAFNAAALREMVKTLRKKQRAG